MQPESCLQRGGRAKWESGTFLVKAKEENGKSRKVCIIGNREMNSRLKDEPSIVRGERAPQQWEEHLREE